MQIGFGGADSDGTDFTVQMESDSPYLKFEDLIDTASGSLAVLYQKHKFAKSLNETGGVGITGVGGLTDSTKPRSQPIHLVKDGPNPFKDTDIEDIHEYIENENVDTDDNP